MRRVILESPYAGDEVGGGRKLDPERQGDWISTLTGRAYPFDPRPEDFSAEEIAACLSKLCRFNGHCREFYSVAQHSVLVSFLLPADIALWGLLHDAPEAYTGDIVRPVKRAIREESKALDVAEEALTRAIAERFGLPWPMPEAVHWADNVALMTEARDLMNGDPLAEWYWPEGMEPIKSTITPMTPDKAEALWLQHFRFLEELARGREIGDGGEE